MQCKSDNEPPKHTFAPSWRTKIHAMSLCKTILDVIERKTISSGLELIQTDNIPSLLRALHLLHITNSPTYTGPTSQHVIDNT